MGEDAFYDERHGDPKYEGDDDPAAEREEQRDRAVWDEERAEWLWSWGLVQHG